ncbi:hypothetical protein OPT61_g4946 [Boeremia exigua]|uniref:Uncharacterized protein n=1 Tax=Boeremia exigua TaxID=749465 RepID=A0ACC2IC69_9PLEO|nr:hypothetical protein OPT61_g4946 [Boeremia exigua]
MPAEKGISGDQKYPCHDAWLITKVRCSGGAGGCEACVRLSFTCSLSESPSPVSPLAEGSPVSLRVRGGRACDGCRRHRARCVRSSEQACVRCQQQSRACVFSLSVRQYRVQEQRQRRADIPPPDEFPTPPSGVETGTTTTEALTTSTMESASTIDSVLNCDKAEVRKHINAFFEFINPVPGYNFLHRANILRLYSLGSLPSVLLLAICGAASRYLSTSDLATNQARSWIEAAESKVLKSLGEAKPYHAEALVILGFNRRCNHQSGKMFFFVSLAARMVYHLKLHQENHSLTFVEQESRRRLVWCIFTVDRFCAGGIKEYLALPTSSVHVQLPCADRYFETDNAVKTCFLMDKGEPASELSISALMLRLFDIRNRVLQYAKVHLESLTSPETSLTEFKGFEDEFQNVYGLLAPEEQFSTHAFELRAFSPERTTFIMFHVYFHHCQCELYRLLNPGYREALHESVISSTSPDFVVYAQTQCLEHAIAIGETITATYQLVSEGPYISDPAIFVMLYQASCAILYACHRDSPAFSISPATAQQYFDVFINALVCLLKYFPKFQIYVEDIRNMLRSITHPNAPLPRQKADVEVDFRARPIPESERSDSGESTVPPAAQQGTTFASPADPNLNQGISSHIFASPAVVDAQALQTRTEYQWPYLGTDHYDLDLISDPSHSLLWDWAEALGPSNLR